jgi:hypothetical protein
VARFFFQMEPMEYKYERDTTVTVTVTLLALVLFMAGSYCLAPLL